MMQVSILGLGLIGGSIGMALKKATNKYKIVGYSRRSSTGFLAMKMGAIDVYEGNIKPAVEDANIAIIATPIMAIKEILKEMAPHVKRGCIVSDVGSTKKQVMSRAKSILPRGVEFIGGHPMAGKEKSGIEYAEANLFQGCTYCLVPGSGFSENSMRIMEELVRDLGAKPVVMEAMAHDKLVAAISHVPFLVSCALFSSASASEEWDKMKALASTGFRDTTRLVSGDPAMYRDICLTNAKNIKFWLKAFTSSLKKLEKQMSEGEEELERAFLNIKKARDKWVEERKDLKDH